MPDMQYDPDEQDVPRVRIRFGDPATGIKISLPVQQAMQWVEMVDNAGSAPAGEVRAVVLSIQGSTGWGLQLHLTPEMGLQLRDAIEQRALAGMPQIRLVEASDNCTQTPARHRWLPWKTRKESNT